jgi:hypothetical protein
MPQAKADQFARITGFQNSDGSPRGLNIRAAPLPENAIEDPAVE